MVISEEELPIVEETGEPKAESELAEFLGKYDAFQRERELKFRFNKLGFFQQIYPTIAMMGFYHSPEQGNIDRRAFLGPQNEGHRIQEYGTLAINKDEKETDKAEIADNEPNGKNKKIDAPIISEDDKEKLDKAKRLGDFIAKAEYLTPELPSLSIDFTPPKDFSQVKDFDHLLGYKSPAILQVKFSMSEMLYFAALKAGYTPEECHELMFDEETQKKVLPIGYRQQLRRKEGKIAMNFPLTNVDLYTEKDTEDNDRLKDPQTIFNDNFQLLQKKFINFKYGQVNIHGWTGSEDITRSLEPNIETDLTEAFFANLSPEEQESALTVSFQGLDEFTEDVSMENGFGPKDHAHDLSFLLSSIGITHQFGKDNYEENGKVVRDIKDDLSERTLVLGGHSMGGGAVAHVAIKERRQIARSSKMKVVFGMFHPAMVIEAPDGGLLNNNYWSNAEITDKDAELIEEVKRYISAKLLSKYSLRLKQFLTIRGKIPLLNKIYKLPEGIVGTILAQGQLLNGEILKQRTKSHLEKVGQDTEAATFCAVGSNYDVPIKQNEIEALFSENEENTNHNEFMVSADGPDNRDRMVNAKQTLLALPPDVPLFVIFNGTHYSFKWRSEQMVMDMLTHTARKLNRSEWLLFNKITKKMYEKRKQEGYRDLKSIEIIQETRDEFLEELSKTFNIDLTLVRDYIKWRIHTQHALATREGIEKFETSGNEELTFLATKAKNKKLSGIPIRWLYASSSNPFTKIFLEGSWRKIYLEQDQFSEQVASLNRLEQLLRCLDVTANMAHFNDPLDPIITREWYEGVDTQPIEPIVTQNRPDH